MAGLLSVSDIAALSDRADAYAREVLVSSAIPSVETLTEEQAYAVFGWVREKLASAFGIGYVAGLEDSKRRGRK